MLTIMVALNCEAKPLIDYWRLKKTDAQAFGLYRSTDPKIHIELVVTGIGALAMSAAVGWIAAQPHALGQTQRAWLNIGTAGHADRSLGELILVHGSGDAAEQRSHYPPMIINWKGQSDSVLSVNAPSNDYPGGAAVDMEAYAFYTAALRFSDSELVQALKVISDNEACGIENLSAAKITDLITPHVEKIDQFGQASLALIPRPFVLADDFEHLSTLRGTHSQRMQLADLMQKLQVLSSADEELNKQTKSAKDLKQALSILRARLNDSVPSLSGVSE